MRPVTSIKSMIPRVFVALSLLALAVRFAIPAGTMMQAPLEAGGLPTLVICTSTGTAIIDAGKYGVPGEGSQNHTDGLKAGDHCVFAAMAATAPPPAPSVIDRPLSFSATAPSWASVLQRPGRGLAAPPPPATGPPSLV
ncbi:DUF2946 family protein [Iodidimonas sp. SYSU 1G8]|uniref:DUF2946 family protein n=1 Tax=Iodidimonas sp. SYSU 1G8 TaxID=3133967 RepID=UPI0031FE860E